MKNRILLVQMESLLGITPGIVRAGRSGGEVKQFAARMCVTGLYV